MSLTECKVEANTVQRRVKKTEIINVQKKAGKRIELEISLNVIVVDHHTNIIIISLIVIQI